jgi:tetratricopeptide (TPR) repeat protein
MASYSDDLPSSTDATSGKLTDDQAYQALDRRLSILEERTAPKPKPFIERINAWSGIATFLLAVIFTYALGAWDRFFVSPVTERRNLIGKLTDIDIEVAKLIPTLSSDPQALLNVSTMARSKKIALLQGGNDLSQGSMDALSLGEVQLLGWHYASVNDIEPAGKLYDAVLKKAQSQKNTFIEADTYRLLANLQTAQAIVEATKVNPEANKYWPEARKLYDRAIQMFVSDKQPQFYNAASAASEWVTLEALDYGSQECAYALSSWAIETMSKFDPSASNRFLIQQISWLKKLQLSAGPQHHISSELCPRSIVGFMEQEFREAVAYKLKAAGEASTDLPAARKDYDKAIRIFTSNKQPRLFSAANIAIDWAKLEASSASGVKECAYALSIWALNQMGWFDQAVADRWQNEPWMRQLPQYFQASGGLPGPCPETVVGFIDQPR